MRTSLLVHGALLLVSLLFGVNYVIAKVALREIPPLAMVVLRTWGATAILAAAWRMGGAAAAGAGERGGGRRSFVPPAADLARFFLYSLLGISINQALFLEGLERSTATNAALILVTIPILTLGFAVALGRERATVAGIAGILLGLSGALLLILPRGVDLSARSSYGNLLLLLNGASYALYLVLTRPILARYPPVAVVTWVFALAAVTTLPLGASELSGLARTGASTGAWACTAYVIVGGTVLPYFLNNWALVRAASSFVAVYIFVQPLIAGTLGRLFLGEALGSHAVVAAVLIATGVFLSGWRPGQGGILRRRVDGDRDGRPVAPGAAPPADA